MPGHGDSVVLAVGVGGGVGNVVGIVNVVVGNVVIVGVDVVVV